MDFQYLARALTGKESSEVSPDELERVRQVYETLGETHKRIVHYRFGLTSHLMTLEEVGLRLGMARHEVKEAEMRALYLLRRRFNQPRP